MPNESKPSSPARVAAEKHSAEEIAARNRKVCETQAMICRVARLSPNGKHGIDFFDAIMEVYFAGREAGREAYAGSASPRCPKCDAPWVKRPDDFREWIDGTLAAYKIYCSTCGADYTLLHVADFAQFFSVDAGREKKVQELIALANSVKKQYDSLEWGVGFKLLWQAVEALK